MFEFANTCEDEGEQEHGASEEADPGAKDDVMDGPSTSSDVSGDNSWSLLSDAGRAELVVQGRQQASDGRGVD